MKRKVIGILVLIIAALAGGVVLFSLFQKSMELGMIYMGICVVGALVILLLFCAKCKSKHDCGHIIPGLMVRMVNRPVGPYTAMEMSMVGIALVTMLFFPVVGLWGQWITLLIYGVLIGATFFGIGIGQLCLSCKNVHCPVYHRCHNELENKL
ncbi:hypothetical protein KAR48_05190 [bacterium]|nr:hypothetical protein [bacterium]